MATWKSAAYDGRYLQLDISESVNVVGNSSTLSWTLTSTGGASTYYTIDTTTVTINGTTVYSKGRTYWDDRVFPAKKGSVSGTITVAHDSNGSKTIAKSGSVTVTLSVTDSRGYTAETSQTVTVIPYTKPKISSITLRRTNDIEAEMQLKFSGSISAVTVNGTQKNSVVYVRYRYRKTSESSYGSYTSIYSGTTKSGTSFSYSNLELCSLDANSSYDFHLQIQDKLYSLSSLDLYFTVPQGTPLIALRKKKVGINTPDPQAMLDVDGNIHMNGVNVHGKMGRVDGSTTDLNNVKTPGYYFAYSASTEKHFPTTAIGMLEVFLPESYFIQQRYTVYNGSRMYIRGNYGGTWSSWHTVSLTTVT